jgi:hypothetical protein
MPVFPGPLDRRGPYRREIAMGLSQPLKFGVVPPNYNVVNGVFHHRQTFLDWLPATRHGLTLKA